MILLLTLLMWKNSYRIINVSYDIITFLTKLPLFNSNISIVALIICIIIFTIGILLIMNFKCPYCNYKFDPRVRCFWLSKSIANGPPKVVHPKWQFYQKSHCQHQYNALP